MYAAASLGLVVAGVILLAYAGPPLLAAQSQLQQCNTMIAVDCERQQRDVAFFTAIAAVGGVALPFGVLFVVSSFWYHRKYMRNAVACPNPNCQQVSFDADRCPACDTELWVYPRKCPHCNANYSASTDKACADCGHDLLPAWEASAAQAGPIQNPVAREQQPLLEVKCLFSVAF